MYYITSNNLDMHSKVYKVRFLKNLLAVYQPRCRRKIYSLEIRAEDPQHVTTIVYFRRIARRPFSNHQHFRARYSPGVLHFSCCISILGYILAFCSFVFCFFAYALVSFLYFECFVSAVSHAVVDGY